MAKMIDLFTRMFSFQSNRQRGLIRVIDRLEWKAQMARETIALEEKQLDEKRAAKLQTLDRRLKKGLYSKELALMDAKEAAEEAFRQQLPSMQKKQNYAWRKLRQDLRRQEGLLDKSGRLLPGKTLSNNAQARLDTLADEHRQEQGQLKTSLLEKMKTSRLKGEQLTQHKAEYEQGMAQKESKLKQAEKHLAEADQRRKAGFSRKQKALADKAEEQIRIKKAELKEEKPDSKLTLPKDVCLRLDHLSMSFGGLKAVEDLSFDVKQGEIFGLIGPNGAGKTTVFNCITQFYKPTAGDILYRNREGKTLRLNDYQVHDIISQGIVRTFQNVEVIWELSILENLLIAAHPQFRSSLFQQMFNTRRVKQEEMVLRERAMKVLDYCGLTLLKDLPPLGQPYGILKRIELARTLMAGANLIILDEPAAGLNEGETHELTRLIRKIREEYKATIFVVEHDMGLIMDICDHICAISFGKKLAYGTPQEIQSSPSVQEAYLGTRDTGELEAV